MSYFRTSGLGATGLSFPPGYSIAGNCDPASGAPTGNTTGSYAVITPSGVQCLTWAQILANWGAPITVQTQTLPPAWGPTAVDPVLLAHIPQQAIGPAPYLGPAPNLGQGAAAATPNPLAAAMAWISANLFLSAVLGVGAVWLLTKK